MLASHVLVDTLTFGERLQADPTNVCLALDACNVVAPLVPLDRNIASGAVFDVVPRRPFFEELVPAVPIRAIESIVRFRMAMWADTEEARWALHHSSLRTRSVDLGAVGGRAVMQFLGVCVDIGG